MLYFNSEVGDAITKKKACDAITATANSYYEFIRKCKSVKISAISNISEFRLYYTGDYGITIKELLHLLDESSKNMILIMLKALSNGKKLNSEFLEKESENWEIQGIGCCSPLLEYAAKNEGIMLTIATTPDWEQDFFHFNKKEDIKLPNIWGQEDLSHAFAKYQYHLKQSKNYEDFLLFKYQCKLCNGAIKKTDLVDNEWRCLLELMERAANCSFTPTSTTYPIKSLAPIKNIHGTLLELKHDSGIRFFLTKGKQGPIIGGYYKKTMGISQKNAIDRANTRINSFNY